MKSFFLSLILPFSLFAACPEYYTEVPANADLGVEKSFCVMTYEARAELALSSQINLIGCKEEACSTANWAKIATENDKSSADSYRPASTPEGLPWRMIDQENARRACKGLGSNYALISNREWMTIANNIENQNANWSGKKVGVGHLNRGHSDNNPPNPCDSKIENVQGDCKTTGDDFHQKRTHLLSNGQKIWDLAGNLWNWNDWNIPTKEKAYASKDSASLEDWREFTDIDKNIEKGKPMEAKLWMSLKYKNHNSQQNIGRYWSGVNTSGGAAIRGSRWRHGESAGIYTLDLNSSADITSANVTFRCVYRPN